MERYTVEPPTPAAPKFTIEPPAANAGAFTIEAPDGRVILPEEPSDEKVNVGGILPVSTSLGQKRRIERGPSKFNIFDPEAGVFAPAKVAGDVARGTRSVRGYGAGPEVTPAEALDVALAGADVRGRMPGARGAKAAAEAAQRAPEKAPITVEATGPRTGPEPAQHVLTPEEKAGMAADDAAKAPKPAATEPPPTPQAKAAVGQRPISQAGKLADDVQKILSPTTRTPESRRAEQVIRQNRSQRASEDARGLNQLSGFRRAFNKLSPDERWQFVDNYEAGQPQAHPKLGGLDTTVRKLYEDARTRVQSLGKGYLETYRENYIRHYWKDPAKAAAVEEQAAAAQGAAGGRRPLKGSGSFLKQRTIDTYREGMAKGLQPLFDDPMEAVATSIRDMNKFYYGEKMKQSLADAGLIRFERGGRPGPGEANIEDRAFQARSPASIKTPEGERIEDPKQLVNRGEWVAPEPVARLLNNYLGKGLYGQSAIYDLLREGGNGLNMLQLGLSGFHATFTTIDTMISRTALGLMQAARGELGSAAGSIAKGMLPTTALRTVSRGTKLRNAILKPEGASPELKGIVDAFEAGGGRMAMDPFYRSTGSANFFHALKDGVLLREVGQTFKNHPITAPLRIAGRTLQTISAPLMEYLVPRQKLGVFYDLAEDWLRAHPNASTLARDEFMTKAWDSVDNRLGQMVYDNVFWNRVQKDLSFLSVRSVGWNLGTVRELGGAGVDTGRAFAKLSTGKRAEFTTRMAYAAAMPIVVGLYGAMLNYLFTGQSPQNWKDYFFPRTGRATKTGAPERVVIPSYIKDVIEYSQHPAQTLVNKMHPGVSLGQQMYQNKDFYGGIIYNPDDPTAKQAMDVGEFLFGQATPFSFRGQQRMAREGTPEWQQALSFFGFQPAPGYITDPAHQAAAERKYQTVPGLRRRAREQQQGLR